MDNFIDGLKTTHTVGGDGVFTLSEEKALAKMAEFSFSSEGEHLLRLLQVAYLSGSREVHVKLGSRTDTMRWKSSRELPDVVKTRKAMMIAGESQDRFLRHLVPALRDRLKFRFEWCPGGTQVLSWSGKEFSIKPSRGVSGVVQFSCTHSSLRQAFLV